MFPPTRRDRLLFENDHLIHAHALAEFSLSGLYILHSLANLRIFKALKSLLANFLKIRRSDIKYLNRFTRGNTYSKDLINFNINRSLKNH